MATQWQEVGKWTPAIYFIPGETVRMSSLWQNTGEDSASPETTRLEWNYGDPFKVGAVPLQEEVPPGGVARFDFDVQIPRANTMMTMETPFLQGRIVGEDGPESEWGGGQMLLNTDRPAYQHKTLENFTSDIVGKKLSGYNFWLPGQELPPENYGPGMNLGKSIDCGTSSDKFFQGGDTYEHGDTIYGTPEQQLYRTCRFGAHFVYDIGIQNGKYTLRLHFAEPYFTAPGQRRFDVAVDGKPVYENLDVVADAGRKLMALVKEVPVEVSGRGIEIEFLGRLGDAFICGIDLFPV